VGDAVAGKSPLEGLGTIGSASGTG
jgi:hypothetical protein